MIQVVKAQMAQKGVQQIPFDPHLSGFHRVPNFIFVLQEAVFKKT